MANSPIDIANMALAEIGTRSSITAFDDGSVEGYQAGLWYDQLRQMLLRTAPWGFSRGQLVLTQLGDLVPDATAPYPYLFKYAYPPDCLKFRYVLAQPILPPISGQITPPVVGAAIIGPTWLGPSRANRFVVASDLADDGTQSRVLLSNAAAAIGVYTRDVTNVAMFDPLFIDALVAAMAFKMVIPLSGNVGEKATFAQTAQRAILDARVADGNEAVPSSDIVVDWITTRGVGSVWGYGGFGVGGPYGSDWGQCYGGYDNMNWGM